MERKIGEIFELGGEWYQCVESDSCGECSVFPPECGSKVFGLCSKVRRTDNKHVIFKKLEKVGEPFTSVGKLYQHYKVFDIDNVYGDVFWCVHNYKEKTLTIEIKQNKEEMEEKKQKLDDLVGLYTSAKITYKEFDEKLKTLYADKEECKSSLKEFDLEAAKSGKPVCTRDRRKARIIAVGLNNKTYPLAAVIENNGEENEVHNYTSDGLATYGTLNDADLMMLPEKKEGWVNVYKKEQNRYVKGIFPSREIALNFISEKSREYIATIKITWEE